MSKFIIYFLLAFSMAAQATTSSQWKLDLEGSQITFVALADNAPFDGKFNRFQALLELNEAAQTKSHLQVTIDLSSVDTQSEDGDALLTGNDFFNIKHWSQATFNSQSIKKQKEGLYTCIALLTIRNIQRKITVTFSYQRKMHGDKEFILLQGSFPIRRLDFDVGLGDWINTDWVANEVNIKFKLRLLAAESHKP